ncbi:hypothetical protein Pint_03532 [Pistacia integerrima]|uniref:Uncharacterized protein n=1 Tax=Pistacia integerrima TaxID=434235 RepID=A0ACC0ZP60_9ROSI|nr:hypothetical protein Pint_03532 [Pistacia integerrima]
MATTTMDCHHLRLNSLPLIYLRLLSQSELLSLSHCSPRATIATTAAQNNDEDKVSTPKIDRSVFHESAGPKVFVAFCCGCKEVGNAGAVDINQDNSSAAKDFSMILEGLADCIACRGNGLQELELRRNAVIVLAFLASSGVSGFEILVNHKLNREANFLMLILQVLVSEMDTEAAGDTVPAENFKARTLLMREALILLNRLVSNPAYSAIVLQILTGSRDMASLTIDVANRFSRKDPRLGESNPSSRQMRESEVVDLGRVFRRRVFTFLGENVS